VRFLYPRSLGEQDARDEHESDADEGPQRVPGGVDGELGHAEQGLFVCLLAPG
jgi:hypothetical protein